MHDLEAKFELVVVLPIFPLHFLNPSPSFLSLFSPSWQISEPRARLNFVSSFFSLSVPST